MERTSEAPRRPPMGRQEGLDPTGGAERRRILLLAPFPPRLDGTHGGSRAIAQLTLHLAERHRVALAYLRAEDEPSVDPRLAVRCEIVHEGLRAGRSTSSLRPWTRALAVLPRLAAGSPLWVAARWDRAFAARVRSIAAAWQPEVVQAEFSVMAQYFDAVRGSSARRVVTVHDPGAQAARDRLLQARPAARIPWRWSVRRWTRFERAVLRAADAAVAFTARDREVLRQLCPEATIEQIALGIAVPDVSADPLGSDPPSLLFVGNFVHPPNVDAARFLVAEIFPALRSRFPRLQLWIVGEGAPPALRKVAGAGVTVTGRVESVAPYLERAAVVVTPLREGGGMRVKVLEALAAGKALVASPRALEGLGVVDGEHVISAEGAAQFQAAVAGLLEDSESRARIARAARAWAIAHLPWSRAVAGYEALYDRLLGLPAGAHPLGGKGDESP